MRALAFLSIAAAGIAYACPNAFGQQATDTSRKDATLAEGAICAPSPPRQSEKYRLPRSGPWAGGLSFATDWAKIETGGWYGIQAMDRCRMKADGLLTWHGKPSVRVEVQPGDDPLLLKANSERTEVLIMQDGGGKQINETAESGVQYYATSYFFPKSWRGQQLPWSAFAPVDCSAGGGNRCNSWSFVWQFYNWGGMTAAQHTPDGAQEYQFNGEALDRNKELTLGKWTDFIFMVDWSLGGFKVWRRDEGQDKFIQVLSGLKPLQRGAKIYIKQGLYRGGAVNGRVDVLWIGPTARGISFDAVELQAFGTKSGVMTN